MNMLVDGEWRTDMFQATNEEGAFERQTTPFRNWIAGSDVPEHIEAERTTASRLRPVATTST